MPSFFPVQAIKINSINLEHGEKIEIVLPDNRIVHMYSTGTVAIYDNGRQLMTLNPYGIAKLIAQDMSDGDTKT